jgi:hypothetical protein
VFDWSAIVPQYQALWAEQNARRQAATPQPPRPDNPYRPDPFRLFEGYPTRAAETSWAVSVPPGVTWADAEQVLKSPLAVYSNFHRPTLEEARQVFDRLQANGPATVAELAAQVPSSRRPYVQRGILWMARFGAVLLEPSA